MSAPHFLSNGVPYVRDYGHKTTSGSSNKELLGVEVMHFVYPGKVCIQSGMDGGNRLLAVNVESPLTHHVL